MVWKVCNATLLGSLLVLFAVSSPVAAAPGDAVGSGHIASGAFFAYDAVEVWLIGPGHTPEAAPYAFTLPVDTFVGETVETVVTDHTGAGYFVKMGFAGDGRNIEADCTITEDSHALLQEPYGLAELRSRCVVPPGAEVLTVYAHTGVDLDVDVVVV